MGKYSGLTASSARLIKRKGCAAVLTAPNVTVDPVSQAPTAAPTSANVFVVRRGLSTGRNPKESEGFGSGSLVSENMANFIIAMQGVTLIPAAGFTLTVAGIVWKIEWVDLTDPASDGAVVATVRATR